MYKIARKISILLVFILVAGCVKERIQPLHNAVAVTIPQKLHNAPISVIEDAILEAGVEQGWQMEEITPGTLRAILKIRTHRAEVNIFYSTTAYSITYADSTNLLYSQKGIHRNYNSWIKGLERKIDSNLYLVKPNPNWQASNRAEDAGNAEGAGDAKSAWLAIENSKDTDQFISFLASHGDSAYAPKAAARLKQLLDNDTANRFSESLGVWNIVVDFVPLKSTSSWCYHGRQWNFDQNITRQPVKREVWEGSIAFYMEVTNVDEVIYLNFTLPAGGGKWDWDKPLVLDKPVKTFNAEAATGGGNYNNCLSKMIVKMTKKS